MVLLVTKAFIGLGIGFILAELYVAFTLPPLPPNAPEIEDNGEW